jgi:hypothetical protein
VNFYPRRKPHEAASLAKTVARKRQLKEAIERELHKNYRFKRRLNRKDAINGLRGIGPLHAYATVRGERTLEPSVVDSVDVITADCARDET